MATQERVKRPATVPASRATAMPASTRAATASRRQRFLNAQDDEEALGWPELPPIFQFRSGMARESVGRGVDYCLPVDKARLSVGNDYRADLRCMFQMPYVQMSRMFDDARLFAVASHHLRPNTAHSPCRKEVTRIIDSFVLKADDDVQLRKASASLSRAPKQAVEHYCNTSPDNRPLFIPERMQTRSKLFVPFNSGTAPSTASIEARATAESILRELNIGPELLSDSREEKETEEAKTRTGEQNKEEKRKNEDRGEAKWPLTRLKNAGFGCYDDVKRVGETFRLEMPENARSPFLDEEANAKIWDWLTDTSVMSDFDFFMVLCE